MEPPGWPGPVQAFQLWLAIVVSTVVTTALRRSSRLTRAPLELLPSRLPKFQEAGCQISGCHHALQSRRHNIFYFENIKKFFLFHVFYIFKKMRLVQPLIFPFLHEDFSISINVLYFCIINTKIFASKFTEWIWQSLFN